MALRREIVASVNLIFRGESGVPSERLRLKRCLDKFGYVPPEKIAGTLADLSSNLRINLTLRMAVSFLNLHRQWQEGNRPGALRAFPGSELVLVRPHNPDVWVARWNDARLKASATATEARVCTGGDIIHINAYAMKNDPIWTRLSFFGLPFGPFHFDTSATTDGVSYSRAVALGIMGRYDNPIPPMLFEEAEWRPSIIDFDDRVINYLTSNMSDDDENDFQSGTLRLEKL